MHSDISERGSLGLWSLYTSANTVRWSSCGDYLPRSFQSQFIFQGTCSLTTTPVVPNNCLFFKELNKENLLSEQVINVKVGVYYKCYIVDKKWEKKNQ